MRFIKQLVVTVILLYAATSLHAQITSADEMVQKIVAAVKAKDEKAFLALHPNKEQMMGLVSKMLQGIMAELKKSPETMKAFKDEDEKMNMDSLITAQLMKKASPEEMAKMEAKHVKEFNNMLKKGEDKGINWSNIVLTKADIDTTIVADESMVKMFGSDKFRTMKGVLHFTSGSEAYQLSFNKVMFLPEQGGWYGVSLQQVGKEGEKVSTGNDSETEVVVEEISDEANVPPPPPPPPPAKSKQKTKAKTTISKTKTKTKS